jgi:sulfite reductase alpha subunit-like flavoprotein
MWIIHKPIHEKTPRYLEGRSIEGPPRGCGAAEPVERKLPGDLPNVGFAYAARLGKSFALLRTSCKIHGFSYGLSDPLRYFFSSMSKSLLILFGSVTGNAEYCADKAAKLAKTRGFTPNLVSMSEADASVFAEHDLALVITSTYGDGEPPDGAESLYEEVVVEGGQDLSHLKFSVLALGDTSYEQFCKCGHDYDAALEKAGAKRFHPLVECDTDYDTPCDEWIAGVFAALAEDQAVTA